MATTPVSVLGSPHVPPPCNPGRRQLLIATAGVGGVLAAAAAVPFVASLTPSERAMAAGAPVLPGSPPAVSVITGLITAVLMSLLWMPLLSLSRPSSEVSTTPEASG